MFSIGERTTLNPCGSFLWTPANSLKSDPLEITNTRGTQNSWKSYNPGEKKKKQPVCNQTCQDWKTFHASDSSRCTRNNVLWSDTAGGLISLYNCRKDHENEVFSTPQFWLPLFGSNKWRRGNSEREKPKMPIRSKGSSTRANRSWVCLFRSCCYLFFVFCERQSFVYKKGAWRPPSFLFFPFFFFLF